HESSPGGPASAKLARECHHYTPTHFFPDVPPGGLKDGIRCENLEEQTFADASFDLVVTSDVFEHVLDPARAFSEIARTLRPGGAHVFTVPWYWYKGNACAGNSWERREDTAFGASRLPRQSNRRKGIAGRHRVGAGTLRLHL